MTNKFQVQCFEVEGVFSFILFDYFHQINISSKKVLTVFQVFVSLSVSAGFVSSRRNKGALRWHDSKLICQVFLFKTRQFKNQVVIREVRQASGRDTYGKGDLIRVIGNAPVCIDHLHVELLGVACYQHRLVRLHLNKIKAFSGLIIFGKFC